MILIIVFVIIFVGTTLALALAVFSDEESEKPLVQSIRCSYCGSLLETHTISKDQAYTGHHYSGALKCNNCGKTRWYTYSVHWSAND